MTARRLDENGYITIENNPISRIGVFPYMGKSIGAPEPNKVYYVYRPAEELSDVDTVNSFKLNPIIDDHTMLGTGEGLSPADRVGVHGTIGERVYYQDGILYATLKIFSEKLASKIKQGKRDLSLGYRCVYEQASGEFGGVKYDYVQRQMRGNHLALVDEARCDVAVLDHNFTFDHLEINLKENDMTTKKEAAPADNQEKESEDAKRADDLKEMKDAIASLTKTVDAMKKAQDAKEEEQDEKKGKDEKSEEDEKSEKAKDKDDEKKGEDAALKLVTTTVDGLKKQIEAMDAGMVKTIMAQSAKRDTLAKQVSAHIGSFDHAEMDIQEVAKYAVDKLQLTCDSGEELAVLKGYMAAASLPSMDAAPRKKAGGIVTAYLKGE